MSRTRRTRLIGALVALLLVPGLIGLDSAVSSWTSPERRTRVVGIALPPVSAPSYDPGAATILLNGLGRDLGVEQARAISPALGHFGRVLALEYGAVFDPAAAADGVHDDFVRSAARPPWHLTVVTSSMGDVRGLELIAALADRHPDVRVEGFVVNTGPGPHKRRRVKGEASQLVIDSGCTPFVPGQVALGLLEVVNQAGQGNVRDLRDAGAAYALGQGYRGAVVMDQLCSLTRPPAVGHPPEVAWSVYLMTGTPDDDVVVDNEGAYADWLGVLPGMGVRRVAGATHDNISFRPELFNPLFADDLMPAIRRARWEREKPREQGPYRRQP